MHPVAAGVLGAVEGAIGLCDQAGQLGRAAAGRGDTGADGCGQGFAVMGDAGTGEVEADALGDGGRRIRLDAADQDRELLAAIRPTRSVARTTLVTARVKALSARSPIR